MFIITLKNYSNDSVACLYFDISIIHKDGANLLNIEFTAPIGLILEEGYLHKDMDFWPAKNFKVHANTLFSEKELKGLQTDYYSPDADCDDYNSETMVILKQELFEYWQEIFERMETKVHIVPSIGNSEEEKNKIKNS